jgi:hypothetical protein
MIDRNHVSWHLRINVDAEVNIECARLIILSTIAISGYHGYAVGSIILRNPLLVTALATNSHFSQLLTGQNLAGIINNCITHRILVRWANDEGRYIAQDST